MGRSTDVHILQCKEILDRLLDVSIDDNNSLIIRDPDILFSLYDLKYGGGRDFGYCSKGTDKYENFRWFGATEGLGGEENRGLTGLEAYKAVRQVGNLIRPLGNLTSLSS